MPGRDMAMALASCTRIFRIGAPLLIGLVLAASLAVARPLVQGADLEQLARTIQARYARGEHDAALSVLREMVRTGQVAVAEQLLRRGIESGARNPEFRYLLGFCLTQRYQYEQAEKILREALATAPRQDGWRHTLARCLMARGRNREAVTVLDQAIALRSRPEYHFAKAMCSLNLGQLDVAEAELETCRAANPADAAVLFSLGTLAADRGEDQRALELFRAARTADPVHLEALFKLGLAESKVGDPERAITHFEDVLAQVPGHVGALFNLGRTLIRVGRREEGKARLETFREMSVLEDEISFLTEFVKRDPIHVEKRTTLADLLLHAGRTGEAITELEAARKLDPRRSTIYRMLAQAFLRSGRKADAAQSEAFAEALQKQGR